MGQVHGRIYRETGLVFPLVVSRKRMRQVIPLSHKKATASHAILALKKCDKFDVVR